MKRNRYDPAHNNEMQDWRASIAFANGFRPRVVKPKVICFGDKEGDRNRRDAKNKETKNGRRGTINEAAVVQ